MLLFKCGHEKSEDNSKLVRAGKGIACKQCFQAHNRKYINSNRKAQRDALSS